MTRRRVIFIDKNTGKVYITPEFNGDKEELKILNENTKYCDSCDKIWSEILKERFGRVRNLEDFKTASDFAQMDYHSFLGIQVLPVEVIKTKKQLEELSKADKIFCIEVDGNIIELE